jgi:Holliday junction DNA helicase RuvA
MISRIAGRLDARALDRVEVSTTGGVSYQMAIPLSTFEALPPSGQTVALYTHLVVREDEWILFGFATLLEREVFRRLLAATGVGPAVALGMLSRFAADRLVRAIREKDVATLQTVPRVGRKKAQQLVLDLADKFDDLLAVEPGLPRPEGQAADDAIRALVALGYQAAEAERAVRDALETMGASPTTPEVIRVALTKVGKR